MAYDLQGALNAHVKPAEIAAHLKSKYGYDYAAAVNAGISTADITTHLQRKGRTVADPAQRSRDVDAKGSFLRSPTGPTFLSQRKPTLLERLSDLREPEQTFRVPKSPLALLQMTGMHGPREDAVAAGLTRKITGPPRQMLAKGMSEYILEPGVPLLGQKMGRGRPLFGKGVDAAEVTEVAAEKAPQFIDSERYAELMAKMSAKFESPSIPARVEDYIPKPPTTYPGAPAAAANRVLPSLPEQVLPTRTAGEASQLQQLLSQPGKAESLPKLAGEAIQHTPGHLRTAEDILRPRVALQEHLGPIATGGTKIPKKLSKAFIKETDALLKKPGHLLTAEDMLKLKARGRGGETVELLTFGALPKKMRNAVEGFFRPQSRMAKGEEFLVKRGRYLGQLDRFDRLIEKLVAPTRKWTPEVKKSAYRAAIQEIPLSALPEYARKPVQRIQSTLRIVGNKLVVQGEMSRETFSKLEGKYLRRAYLKHILPEKAFYKGGGGGPNRGFLNPRYEYTKAEQEAMGLIEDISVSATHSLTPELHTVARNTYFNDLAKEPTMVHPNSFVRIPTVKGKMHRVPLGELDDTLETYGKILEHDPTNTLARGYYEKLKSAREAVPVADIPNDFVPLKGKKYGVLNGAYVHKTIQRDIQPLHVLPLGEGTKIVNALKTVNDSVMTGFKIAKTALNPPTMAVNAVSGAAQMLMGGMQIHEIIPYYIRAIREYIAKGVSYQQMLRRGAFRGNFATGELNEVLARFTKLPKNPSIGDIFSAFSGLTKFYGKIDDVSKLAMYMRIKEKGMPFSLTKRALFEGTKLDAAAKEAIEWGMDYSFAHPAVKIARKKVMPFATFKYKALPLITKSLKARPWVIGGLASLPYAITEAGKQYRDLSENDWKKLRHDLPSFIAKSNTYAFFPFKDDQGNWGWVDLQRFMPWGDVQRLGQAIADGDAGEIYDNSGIGNPFLTLARAIPLTKGDSPLVDPYTQRPVYFAADSPGNKLLKTMEWLFTQMAPGIITRQGMLGQTVRAVKKQRDRYNTVPSLGEALARGVGVNISHPDPKQRRVEKKYKNREAKSALRRLLRDPRNKGDDKYRNESRARTRKKLRDIRGER